MLYIISEIRKSLFYWHPGLSVNLCFPHSQAKKNNQIKKNNITPCCFGYKMDEEKRKTENSTDQKVSVFPESRELTAVIWEGYRRTFHLS